MIIYLGMNSIFQECLLKAFAIILTVWFLSLWLQVLYIYINSGTLFCRNLPAAKYAAKYDSLVESSEWMTVSMWTRWHGCCLLSNILRTLSWGVAALFPGESSLFLSANKHWLILEIIKVAWVLSFKIQHSIMSCRLVVMMGGRPKAHSAHIV